MIEESTPQIPAYAYVLLVFSVWMLVDAYRRKAAFHWYVVILVLPLGAVFYFFFVKLKDFRPSTPSGEANASPVVFPASRPSSPSQLVDLERADTLEASEQYGEAETLYQAALAANPQDLRALHGLGRCRLGQGRAREAVDLLERVVTEDREYRNYGAALDYADALWEAGQREDTVELLENMAEVTGRINHRLALAHYLIEQGQIERARRELERALTENAAAPEEVQQRARTWVQRAQKMLSDLETNSAQTNS